ncbi:MAG: transglutaminase-like cysteine peptidase, partial [Proteobacteria bacterium]|nr:transglutaminase-like cysteine peptidase [Pseudomonadota bacterium]
YWATPLQFFAKDGDCEDYAIAKFVSLKMLGFTNEQMRLVVLDDLNLQIPHAILVVYIGGRAFVLDNQIPKVVPAEVIHHYRPIYSINEDGWWLHRP